MREPSKRTRSGGTNRTRCTKRIPSICTQSISRQRGDSLLRTVVPAPAPPAYIVGFWYDFLTSAGHHKKAALKAAGIGYSFDYAPGTMVALCAADIFHEVDLWYGFDRICIASFMRKSVMKARDLLIPAASTLDQFTAQMDSEFLVNYSKLLCRS